MYVCVHKDRTATNLGSGKTNALGHEFYAIVGEANGQAIPMAFAFTASTDGKATAGAKDRMLQDFVGWVSKRCPNITFTLSDKDTAEINAFRTQVPTAKHQLCYWHAIRYLEERLAENKPPAKYNPRKAHQTFDFIDPTWAPRVTSGWLEDGVHESDAEVPRPNQDQELEPHVRSAKLPLCSEYSFSVAGSCEENNMFATSLYLDRGGEAHTNLAQPTENLCL
jgi:hypothetical protein